MNIGKNIQFLRKMNMGMTQEKLAECLNVSRQTVSKWELDIAVPEAEKLIELSELFNCTVDELLKSEMGVYEEACIDMRTQKLEAFKYISYAVISKEPEDDAINHIKSIAAAQGCREPKIIGWDMPILSQEQINVFHMHGYCAAWVLPKDFSCDEPLSAMICEQKSAKYAVVTIKDPFSAPFRIIPNTYKMLMAYMQLNGIAHCAQSGVIECFEHSYKSDGMEYMDVYIAAE